MSDIQTYKIYTVLEALSPITHMEKTIGNEAIVARTPIQTEYGKVEVPFLSGNAIRSMMVRYYHMKWLVEKLEMKGKLNIDQLNFPFSVFKPDGLPFFTLL